MTGAEAPTAHQLLRTISVEASTHHNLHTELRVGVSRVCVGRGICFNTRTYNGMFPGPTLQVRPGTNLTVDVVNNLGPNTLAKRSGGTETSYANYPNSTNLHIHGVRASPRHDNTFVEVAPGERYRYTYIVNNQTGSSLLWYHAHLEGTSSMQLYGGMAGAFVVKDTQQEATYFRGWPEAVVVIQQLVFDTLHASYFGKYMACDDHSITASALDCDIENPSNYTGWMLLANGQNEPRVDVVQNQMLRLRLINAMSGSVNLVHLAFDSDTPCTMHTLALDGVFLSAPRHVNSVLLPPGGRADLAVQCTEPGLHFLRTTTKRDDSEHFYGQFPEGHALVVLNTSEPSKQDVDVGDNGCNDCAGCDGCGGTVGGGPVADDGEWPKPGPPQQAGYNWPTLAPTVSSNPTAAPTPRSDAIVTSLPLTLPGPPAFYPDLVNSEITNNYSVRLGNPVGGNVVNGYRYNRTANHVMKPGDVEEWELSGGETPGTMHPHPYHHHMTHFQVIRVGGVKGGEAGMGVVPGADLMAMVGDYRDTVVLYAELNYTVRFVVPFPGLMMIHCHILKHEDRGMMTLANSTGGKHAAYWQNNGEFGPSPITGDGGDGVVGGGGDGGGLVLDPTAVDAGTDSGVRLHSSHSHHHEKMAPAPERLIIFLLLIILVLIVILARRCAPVRRWWRRRFGGNKGGQPREGTHLLVEFHNSSNGVPEMEIRPVAKSVSSLGRISEGSWGEMSQISQGTAGSADGEDEDGTADAPNDGERAQKRPSGGWGKWQAYFP